VIRAYYAAQARPIAPKRGESIEPALERANDARIDIPLRAGESYEDGLARVEVVIRAAMGLPPAGSPHPLRWAEIQKISTGKPSL